MTGTLIRKELLANLLTLRLAVALVFTVLLSALTTVIGSVEHSERMDAYRAEVAEFRKDLDQATVYAQVQPHIVAPPQPLALFCRGVDKTAGQVVEIYIGRMPASLSSLGGTSNDLMKIFVEIDFATVVTVLLSFLAVVLGFDAVCGERERGTLRQMLVNPVPRGSVIVAKLIGGLLSLWIPLALAFVLALLIASSNPDVLFSGDDWVRLALLFILSCLFLGQVFSLSLMVSTLTRDSATALIICLFAWLAGSVGYMNALPSLSRYGVEEVPFQNFMEQNREFWNIYNREKNEWNETHPSPGEAYLKGIQGQGRLRYAHPRGYAWLQQENAFMQDKHMERASRSHKAMSANYQHLAREAFLVDQWSILSPFTNYKALANQLARTTLSDKFRLLKAGHRYREDFIQYLRGRNAFASRRWFTDDPEHQEPMIPHPEEMSPEMLAPDSPFMKERMAWAQKQEELAATDATRQLDLTDLPRFGADWQRNLGGSLAVMTPGLAMLLLTFGGSVLVAMLRFLNYDPK